MSEYINIKEKRLYRFFLSLFFFSGFSALLYQVVWQRMLAIFSGVDTFSVTIIVAAFMGGLGFGSLVGGYISDKLTIRRSLFIFAASELTVAIFAVASKWLYYDLFYMEFNHLAASPAAMVVTLFLGLLVPTFVMGMTLPLLSRALTSGLDSAARTIGSLYGINTLGSAIGALVAGWVLMRLFGLETSLYIGAVISFLCALGAVVAALGFKDAAAPRNSAAEPTVPPPPADERASSPSIGFPAWAAIYALSGLIALSLEILYFRVLGVMLKSTSFTFSTILFVFLLGLSGGTLVGTRLVGRSKRPASTFFLLQGGITVYAALSFSCLIYALGLQEGELFSGLWQYLGGMETVKVNTIFSSAEGMWSAFVIYLAIPLFLLAPPTFLMGLSFTYLHRAVQTDRTALGRRVGWLQTANIAGSVLGAFLAGWVFFDLFGSSGTLRLLIALGSVFLFFWSSSSIKRYALSAIIVAVLIVIVPSPGLIWSRLHGTHGEVRFAEDGTGLTVLKGSGEKYNLYINGFLQSWLPFGHTHTLLGFIPAMLHPAPRDIAVIGFGSGDTVFSIGGRETIEEIRCFELLKHQKGLLGSFNNSYGYEGLRSALEDGRIRLELSDGRAVLKQETRKYDIIEADIARPHNSYAGNLFSYDYFTLVRERLKPGGFVVSWVPTLRTFKTFVKAFPHVLRFEHVIVGSNDPIAYDPALIRERIRDPRTVAYYGKAGFDLEALAAVILSKTPQSFTPSFDRSAITDINTDLHPRDEFLLGPR